MSFAASQEGAGKSFAIQELLDQIGAFLGPVLLYLVMLFKNEGSTFDLYRKCFAFLALPGSLTIFLLFLTKSKFPNPEHFEPEIKSEGYFKMKKSFIYYIVGISFFAFGFIDYSLIIMHISKNFAVLGQGLAETSSLITSGSLPLLYAGAMLVDAIAALVFGYMYDRNGLKALVVSSIISSPFAFFVFRSNNLFGILFGVALWGIGMGAQESILKAAVTSVVPKANRATGYGIFEASFGVFWFLGSWLLGSLYDITIQPVYEAPIDNVINDENHQEGYFLLKTEDGSYEVYEKGVYIKSISGISGKYEKFDIYDKEVNK